MDKNDYATSNIKINVNEFKPNHFTPNVYMYVVEVATRTNKWSIQKRYSDFDELVKSLKKIYHNIPPVRFFKQLPGKSLLPIKQSAELQKRKKGLDDFLKVSLTNRTLFVEKISQIPKLLNNSFNLTNTHHKQYLILLNFLAFFKTILLAKIQPENKKVSYNLIDIFFIATGDMSTVSRLGAYITNSKKPWEKDSSNKQTLLAVGSVQCWINTSQYIYEKLWSKIYSSQAICLQFSKAGDRLLVGLDDGTIDTLLVQFETNYDHYQNLNESKFHNGRIMGIYYDSISCIAYSISQDKQLGIIEMNNFYKINSILHKDSLTVIVPDKINKRLFIGSKGGQVFIYDFNTNVQIFHQKTNLILLCTLSTKFKGSIRSIQIDLMKNYCFTGGFDDGQIAVFDIDKPGRQKFIKQVASFKGKDKIRAIQWSNKRAQIFSGLADGFIMFWNAPKGVSIYVLLAHNTDITKLCWLQEKGILISASKGKQIKFWQLPKEWRDKKLQAIEEKEIFENRKIQNARKVKDAVEKAQLDSDQDDLAGWHLQ